MKWIFNVIFVSRNLILFYSYIIAMILMIIIAMILVAKEIKNQNAFK